jgi:hypothetical protein
MTVGDERIAWMLTAEAIECDGAEARTCLSVGAAAGFRAVAISPSTSASGSGQAIQAEAQRLGMHCIVLEEAAHYRLGAPLSETERREQAHALARDGFDGMVLCVSRKSRTRPELLLATARALVRDLDQRDWELFH